MNVRINKKICSLREPVSNTSFRPSFTPSFVALVFLIVPALIITLSLLNGSGMARVMQQAGRRATHTEDSPFWGLQSVNPYATAPENNDAGGNNQTCIWDPTVGRCLDFSENNTTNESSTAQSTAPETLYSNSAPSNPGMSKPMGNQKPLPQADIMTSFSKGTQVTAKKIENTLLRQLSIYDPKLAMALKTNQDQRGGPLLSSRFLSFLEKWGSNSRLEAGLQSILPQFRLTSQADQLVRKELTVHPFVAADIVDVLATVSGLRVLTIGEQDKRPGEHWIDAYFQTMSSLADKLNALTQKQTSSQARPNGQTTSHHKKGPSYKYVVERGTLFGNEKVLFYEKTAMQALVDKESQYLAGRGLRWPKGHTLINQLEAGLNSRAHLIFVEMIGTMCAVDPDEQYLNLQAANAKQGKPPKLDATFIHVGAGMPLPQAQLWATKLGHFFNGKSTAEAAYAVPLAIETQIIVHENPIPEALERLLRMFYERDFPSTDHRTFPGLDRNCFNGCPSRDIIGHLLLEFRDWQIGQGSYNPVPWTFRKGSS